MQTHLLSDYQIGAIFQAIEREQEAHELSAAELTTINGIRGNFTFVDQITYIRGYDVVTDADGGGALQPEIGVVSAGIVVDIMPFMSADRRYVTMDIQPVRSRVLFQQESITTFTAGAVLQFPLDLPLVRTDEARTRVMIPDGGTIMVGGFEDHADETARANVPVIGHIPFLGRLFGTRGRYSSRYRLFVTAKVDLILYDELENEQ